MIQFRQFSITQSLFVSSILQLTLLPHPNKLGILLGTSFSKPAASFRVLSAPESPVSFVFSDSLDKKSRFKTEDFLVSVVFVASSGSMFCTTLVTVAPSIIHFSV